eukprot:jgi/Tetstr1/461815/TSEL_006896.t1
MAMQESSVGLPAVLVLPDWDGLNEYEFKRVQMLASMGYVALGVDIYGVPSGTVVEDFVERSAQAIFWRSNPELYVQRIRVALVSLKLFAFVDGEAVALIGYCFGGSVVVFDVFSDSNLKVDVSFHGGLANKPPMTTAPPMKPYLSYQNERRRR